VHHVTPSKPVAIYARISDDQEEEARGVGRQVKDCTTVGTLREWPTGPDHHYIDNSVSAYKRGVRRPEWERLMTDLEAGAVGGVITYDLDRWARQPKDLERTIELFTAREGLVFATVQGDINLMTPDGITMARVMVAFANKSSMDTARRVKRKHLDQAHEGQPVGGWRTAGWQADKLTLDPFESNLIKEAAKRIVKGVSLYRIAKEWNEAGFKTPRGNAWVYQTARSLMMNDRLAGYRNLHGQPLLGADGARVQGLWEPILTPEEHKAVVKALTSSLRGGTGPHGPRGTKKYLLSGLIQCGVCFGPMYGTPTKYGHNYTCPTSGGKRRSCGTVAVNGTEADRLMTDLFHAQGVDREEVEIDHATLITAAEQRLEEVAHELGALGAQFGAGSLPAEFVAAAVGPLNARKEEALSELERLREAQLHAGVVTYLGGRPWVDLETDEKRALIGSQFPSILVKRAKSKGGHFDAGRIVPSRTKVPVYDEQTPVTGAPAALSGTAPTPDVEPQTTEP
jgi:DNA invertase Pin-like site-specific DNA recombinase